MRVMVVFLLGSPSTCTCHRERSSPLGAVCPAPDEVRRKSPVLFGPLCLLDVVARKTANALDRRQGRERLAGIHLARWRNRLDPRGPADVSSRVVPAAGAWALAAD